MDVALGERSGSSAALFGGLSGLSFWSVWTGESAFLSLLSRHLAVESGQKDPRDQFPRKRRSALTLLVCSSQDDESKKARIENFFIGSRNCIPIAIHLKTFLRRKLFGQMEIFRKKKLQFTKNSNIPHTLMKWIYTLGQRMYNSSGIVIDNAHSNSNSIEIVKRGKTR